MNSKQLVSIPFSKTECGVDFFINTLTSHERSAIITEPPAYQTEFFIFYFFHHANGYLRLGVQKIELHEHMVLIVKPRQRQEWHVNESELDYDFLIFREDFMRTFVADKFFIYRLQYCQQISTPPYYLATQEELENYLHILSVMRAELKHPMADSYTIIVANLCHLLAILNRNYTQAYNLPTVASKNFYSFQFMELIDQHIKTHQRVNEYADMLGISRVTLNQSVMAQYGTSATGMLKQRLLAELKNDLLFEHATVSELAYRYHFSDPSHLMHFFKRETGRTCTQFIEDYHSGNLDL